MLNHISDIHIRIPVATLPGAWHYRVSAGTGRRPLLLGEIESLIGTSYVSVSARALV